MSGFVKRTRTVDTTNPAGGVNPASTPNVGQYGWTSYEAGKVDQLIQYVDLCKQYAQSASDKADFVQTVYEESQKFYIYIRDAYEEIKPIIDKLDPIYKDIVVRHEDIIVRHEDVINLQRLVAQDKSQVSDMVNEAIGDLNTIKAESIKEMGDIKDQTVVEVTALKDATKAEADRAFNEAERAKDKAEESRGSAEASEVSNMSSKGWYDKSYELYEELQKGNVYRGTWNPHTAAYPDNQGTNSTWDVVLNEGELEYEWNGVKWFWGDRLVYIKAEDKYQQIESGTSVSSVNGKKGAVLLTYSDVQAAPEGFGLGVGTGARVTNGNLDETLIAGFYGVYGNDTGGPLQGGLGPSGSRLLVVAWNGTHVTQMFYPYNSTDVYVRYKGTNNVGSNNWSEWARLYSTMNKPTATDVAALPIKGGKMTGSIDIDRYAIQGGPLSKNIFRDHGNGNVSMSGSANADGVAGDLYLGYNSGTAHMTKSVRLESPLSWKGSPTIVNADGKLNSENMYGPIRTEQDGTGVWHTIVGGSDTINRGRTIIAAGEAGKQIADSTSASDEVVHIGGDTNAGIYLHTGLQNGWGGGTHKRVKVDAGELYAVDGTKRVYHEGFKPTYTAADVGALPNTGGVLTGQLVIANGLYRHRFVDSSGVLFFQGGKSDLDITDQRIAFSGYSGKPLTETRYWMANNTTPVIRWGSADYKLYHEGYKPSVSDVLTSDLSVIKAFTINAPSGLTAGKYYPILFTGTHHNSSIYITTNSAGADHSMNNCTFDGMIRSGGWSDTRSFVTGQFMIYDTNERALHSLVGSTEGVDSFVAYVAAQAFPVIIKTNSKVAVSCTGKDVTVGTTTYKAGLSGMSTSSDYGTKCAVLMDFNKGNGFYTSEVKAGDLEVGRIKSKAVIAQDYNEEGAFITRRVGLAPYSMMGQATNGDAQFGTGSDSNSLLSYVKVAPNKLAFSPNGSTEHRVYHEGFKPTANELGAVAVGDFGIGGRQGSGALAEQYTEGKTYDFNDLITAGEFTIAGNWSNGTNNQGTAASYTGQVKVKVRHYPAGGAYIQEFEWVVNGDPAPGVLSSFRRVGTGTHPNITWSRWQPFGNWEATTNYRMCIDRSGENVYPYMTMYKRTNRTDLTSGNYVTGALEFKHDALSDENNPASGKLISWIVAETAFDRSSNQVQWTLRDPANQTKAVVLLQEDGITLRSQSKSLIWNGTDLSCAAGKFYHQGYKPALTDLGITGKSIGYSQAIGANVDLDTLKTPGVYHQSANANSSVALNYPEALAGTLVVYQAAGILQEYRVYNTSRIYTRGQYSSGGWTAWAKQYNTLNKPSLSDVIGGDLNLQGNHLTMQDGAASMIHTFATGNSFEIAHGDKGQNRILNINVSGQMETEGAHYARTGQIARSKEGSTWIGMEAPENATPYLSIQSPALSSPVIAMTFNGKETFSSQRMAANEFRVATDAGLKFSPFDGLQGASWGMGMDGATGVLGIHRYQEGVWQNAPIQFSINGETHIHGFRAYGGYGKIIHQNGGNSILEFESAGKHAKMFWLDNNTGDLNLASSNGAGTEAARLGKWDSTGNYSSWGGVYVNTASTTWGGYGGAGICPLQTVVNVTDGQWHPMVTSPSYQRVGAGGNDGYSFRWSIGHYRTPGANNGDFVLNMTGDGLLSGNLRYHFKSGGDIAMEGGSAGSWGVGGSGMLYGTCWGGSLDAWIGRYYAPISDERLKRNIQPSTKSALEDVAQIKFHSYEWKDEGITKDFKGTELGIIAQEMEEISPAYTKDVETFNKDGSVDTSFKALDVTNMLALALKAIQELQDEVNELKEKLNNV